MSTRQKLITILVPFLFVIAIFCHSTKLTADTRMPLEVKLEYAQEPELGMPVKVLISVKPLIDGEELKIKLIIPDKRIESISKTTIEFKRPISGQVYTLPVELKIPDGKAYQIIADGYLTSGGQVYSDSSVMNIDLGKPEAPQYPLIKAYTQDGAVIVGAVGIQSDRPVKPNIVTSAVPRDNYLRGKR